MKVTKEIIITRQDILEYFISTVEDCTISEARKIINDAQIEFNLSKDGTIIKGDLASIRIII